MRKKKIVSNNLTNLTKHDDIVWGATAKLNLYDKLEHLAKKLNYVKRHVCIYEHCGGSS
jgi:hypothetical protein